LLRRFTEEHPDVVGTRRVIEQLEEQKRQELQARKKAVAEVKKGSTVTTSTNPVYQQLKVSLAESEASVAALRARVDELDARYRQLQASARLRPQIDAELAQLNRDYDVQKRNYESLVARRESASITNELDATAGVGDFRIIDPPNVSQRPVAPNRLLLLALILASGLGAGLFTAFVVSQIFPIFHDARALREFTQRPVLGTVALLSSPKTRSRQRRSAFLFAGGVASLCCFLGAAMLIVTFTSGQI
jgi:polysaccharide chain length determinant protein (PEP-CTERM system associated)